MSEIWSVVVKVQLATPPAFSSHDVVYAADGRRIDDTRS